MSYTKTTNFAIKDTYLTGNPAKVIKGVEIDAEFDNIVTADGLNLKRDGSAAATADIPMGGNKLTGLDDGSTASDSITLGQVQNSSTLTIGSVSGTNTVTGTLTPSPAAYVTGQTFRFISAGANTGAVTLNLNGLGAKAITKNGATPLSSGDIPSAAVVQVTYDGTQFQLTSNVTVPPPATDYLNATRIDVASASTVDLTSSAPNTRHINITGTTAITDFTVAAGQCYFVRFNAALTLTNGASLVTQTGADITVAAGDSCIIRATAANVVEVLCGRFRSERGLGAGQNWQDMTGSRATGVTYTNTTGRPIFVAVTCIASAASGYAYAAVNGLLINYTSQAYTSSSYVSTCVLIVPSGGTYSVTGASATVFRWMELR